MISALSSHRLAEPQAAQLELVGLRVDFGATRALDDVSLSFGSGEIVGLLGHNGAGKSTLFNVVSGALAASSGSVSVGGESAPVKPSPSQMAKLGITVIHQEPALAHNLTVVENIFLGQEDLAPRGTRRARAQAALERVGATLDLDREVASLGLGERQLVDLARGLVRGDMRVLMLDEPTAALGRAETDALHALIRQLAADGVTVIYVSHRLPDILDVCTRIVILRAGRVQADGLASAYDGRTLSQALAPDAEFDDLARRHLAEQPEAVALHGTFEGITARAGEIVGLFGMAGGRQFEILECMFGLQGTYDFSVDGARVQSTSPQSAVRAGVHLVPADRERDGLISGNTALDTVFLPWYRTIPGRGAWIYSGTGKEAYDLARSELQILGPDGAAPIDEFSGGNRQKHLIARWAFVQPPKLLLLAQPTQGVDVGARLDIVRAVRAIAETGTTVLVASSESDEIELLCDRAYVIADTNYSPVERSEDFGATLLTTLLSLAETTGKVRNS
ncbi:ATP-binding cassette domain-containing protein [Leucobacter sp. Z1108]